MGDDWSLIRLYGAVSPMSLTNVMKTVINSSELRREDATTAPELSLEPQGDVDERGSHSAACDLEAGGGLAVEDVEGT